jgi:hypothetical protein
MEDIDDVPEKSETKQADAEQLAAEIAQAAGTI